MKLGIFGDSFADIRPWEKEIFENPGCHIHSPWPIILAKHMSAELTVFAEAGTSSWWSYQNFAKNYKKYDAIIFAYSQHNRWHHLSEECKNMHHVTSERSHSFPVASSERLKLSSLLANTYRYVASEELDLFMYQSVFNQVNLLCKNNGIQLVNLFTFDDGTFVDCSARHGACISNLIKLSEIEQRKMTPYQSEKFLKMIRSVDKRNCHMSWYHNNMLAEMIFENLGNPSVTIDVSKSDKISDDPTQSEYLYEN